MLPIFILPPHTAPIFSHYVSVVTVDAYCLLTHSFETAAFMIPAHDAIGLDSGVANELHIDVVYPFVIDVHVFVLSERATV